MSMVHTELCQHCGTVRTRHPSGLCSQCRRLCGPKTHCRVCGAPTQNGRELCWMCEAKGKTEGGDPETVREAIRRHQFALDILRGREAGVSFPKLADQTGLPEDAVREMYRWAVGGAPQ